MQTQKTFPVFTNVTAKGILQIAIGPKMPKGNWKALCLIEALDVTDAIRMCQSRIQWFSDEKRRLLPIIQLAMQTQTKPSDIITGFAVSEPRPATNKEAAQVRRNHDDFDPDLDYADKQTS